ncbi:MAG: hypothetical protein GY820_39320 [Gammaproteobacteria bacterium]|nr:hypothetical protein [Gammaproteobacteria bacterium]
MRNDTFLAVFALVACAVCIGCTTMDSTKFVIYETGSINLHPTPYEIREVTTETGEVRHEMILPDGTFFDVTGMPYMGNLTLVTNQNDGTDQTTRARVDAEVSPAVTGSGSASTTEGDTTSSGDSISEEGEGAVEDTQ